MEGNCLFEQYSLSFVFYLDFIPLLAYFPSLKGKSNLTYSALCVCFLVLVCCVVLRLKLVLANSWVNKPVRNYFK